MNSTLPATTHMSAHTRRTTSLSHANFSGVAENISPQTSELAKPKRPTR